MLRNMEWKAVTSATAEARMEVVSALYEPLLGRPPLEWIAWILDEQAAALRLMGIGYEGSMPEWWLVSDYLGIAGALQTSTWITERAWGTSTYDEAKRFSWALAGLCRTDFARRLGGGHNGHPAGGRVPLDERLPGARVGRGARVWTDALRHHPRAARSEPRPSRRRAVGVRGRSQMGRRRSTALAARVHRRPRSSVILSGRAMRRVATDAGCRIWGLRQPQLVQWSRPRLSGRCSGQRPLARPGYSLRGDRILTGRNPV